MSKFPNQRIFNIACDSFNHNTLMWLQATYPGSQLIERLESIYRNPKIHSDNFDVELREVAYIYALEEPPCIRRKKPTLTWKF